MSILEYDEENNQLDAKVVCSHPNQIWAIEPSPTDPSLVLTSSKQRDGSNPVALYRLPSDDADAVPDDDDRGYGYGKDIKPLEEIAQLSFADSAVFVNSFAWHKARNTVLTLDPASLTMWDIRESGIVASATALATAQDISNMDVGIYSGGAVAWDPHHANLCAMVSDGSLSIIDTRKMTALSSIHKVHRGVARDVDYNSNKPQSIITCGDDRKVKLWDLRAMKSPVSTLEGHSHWVWQAKYNPFHDQLIVSSGSDNLVNLWRVASCSSAPWLGDGLAELEDEEDGDTRGDNDDSEDPPDVRVS
ncbi:EIPR1 [Symbiodinium microadriaticum]|nr:EIPR1 [Symbiodinium microadriaticum]